jgi:hypothetical protein
LANKHLAEKVRVSKFEHPLSHLPDLTTWYAKELLVPQFERIASAGGERGEAHQSALGRAHRGRRKTGRLRSRRRCRVGER